MTHKPLCGWRWIAALALLLALAAGGRARSDDPAEPPAETPSSAEPATLDEGAQEPTPARAPRDEDEAAASDEGEAQATESKEMPADSAEEPNDAQAPAAKDSPEESPARESAASDDQHQDNSDQDSDASKPDEATPDAPAPNELKPSETANAVKAPGPLPADHVTVEPALFKKIRPGRSTEEELIDAWGTPLESQEVRGGVRHRYAVPPFERVMATVEEGKVRSIVVRLNQPVPPADLARQLQLDNIEPVTVYDESERALGQAFPERGVLFSFRTKGTERQVNELVIEDIDPQSFTLRAERRLKLAPNKSLRDVNYAITSGDRSGQAQWVKARVHAELGDWPTARRAAERAIEAEPAELRYRPTLTAILLETADFSGAAEQCRETIETPGAPRLVKARALCQLGDCLALSAERRYAEAIKQHQEAIKLAEPLALSHRVGERRAAKEILLDAHLAVAYDIAAGRWQQKARVVPKWLERARDLADDLVSREEADREVLLRTHRRAITALAAMKNPPRPGDWFDVALSVGKPLVEQPGDAARRRRLSWTLGTALADAVEISYEQHKLAEAMDYGKQAIHYMAAGEAYGHRSAGRDWLVGRLYYRMGAIWAIDRQNHVKALTWYRKAVPLLESPTPPSAAINPGRQGETFVSIAVSYWETGTRDEALRLTQQGLRLMEQGVQEGLLEKAALAVPYGNLANMHEQLGNNQQSEHYAQLAVRHETKKR
jgi:hypothetical protein